MFPGFLRDFSAQYPAVRIKPVEATAIEQLDMLRQGDLHAGISRWEREEQDFIAHVLAPSHAVAAYAAGGRLRLGTTVEVRDLAGHPLLLLSPKFGTRRIFEAACRLERMVPDIFLESSAPETLLVLAAARYGIAIVPTTVRVDRRSLRLARVMFRSRPLMGDLAVLWNRERRLPQYAEAFSATLAKHARRVTAQSDPLQLTPRFSGRDRSC
jgi:LysR family cyn operon transcriptional activator